MKYPILVTILIVLSFSPAHSQTSDTLRICYYNLHDVSATTDSLQFLAMRTVLQEIHPSMLVVQNINDIEGFARFNDIVLSRLTGLGGIILSMNDSANAAIFYDATRVQGLFDATRTVVTGGRPMLAASFIIPFTGDTVDCFSALLTAGSDSASSAERAPQAMAIRRSLDSSTGHIRIGAGTFNFDSWNEEGYFFLTHSGIIPGGELYDPAMSGGVWHNNPDFAPLHTSFTNVVFTPDRIIGGLADRSDFLLISGSDRASYVEGTYTTYGNDGNHFRMAVDTQPNTAVPQAVAEALRIASRHLPVYLDMVFTKSASGVQAPTDQTPLKRMELSQRTDN